MDGEPRDPGGVGDVVWDGAAWTVPATGQRWDGNAWVLSPAAATSAAWLSPPPAIADPITRGSVFVQVAWRALVSSLVGGAAVGFVFVAALIAYEAVAGDVEDPVGLGYLAFGSFFGGTFGLFLGVVAAPVLGAICCWVLVPYRGPRPTIMVPRGLALLTVLGFLAAMFAGSAGDTDILLAVGAIAVLSLVGAWFCGGWLTGWYVRRMEPAPAQPA